MAGLYILIFCRIVIGLTFALSSGSKVLQFRAFQQTVGRFRMLPARLTTPAAILFLGSEIVVVLLMVLGGQLLLPGFALAITLLVLFSSALISVLVRGISTACHCFGSGERSISRADIWRNLGFLLCGLGGCAGVVWGQNMSENLGNIEWLLLGLVAIVFVTVWAQLGELTQLLGRN